MLQDKYNPQNRNLQLTLTGFAAWQLPGYPIRGLVRCWVLCKLYGWPHLGRLAAAQLGKIRGQP
jgi:hypothetical protein